MERSIPAEFRNEREALIWAAALFEGEGCISWTDGGRNRKSKTVQVRLGMTDEDTVDTFAAIMGFGAIYYRHSPAQKAKGYKPLFDWYANGFELSQATIAMIWPWLGERRKAKAAESLLAARYTQHKRDRVRCPAGHLYSGANLRLEKNRVGGRTYILRRCVTCRRRTAREATARYRARRKG